MGCSSRHCALQWWWRQFPPRVVFGPPLLLCLHLLLPGDLFMTQGGVSTSLAHGGLPLHHTLPWGPFLTYLVGAPSPPYDVVIFTLQPMDLEGLQKGGLSSFVGLPRPTLFSSLVGSPMGAEGQFTQLLHVIRRGLCPHEVHAVIQLLPLEDDFVAPPLRLDPLCIVVKVTRGGTHAPLHKDHLRGLSTAGDLHPL